MVSDISIKTKRTDAPANTKRAARTRRNLAPYLFMAPALIVLLFVVALPIAYAFIQSFYNYRWNLPTFPVKFVGLDNYLNIFEDEDLLDSVGWTFSFTAVVVSSELVLGLGLALLLNSQRLGRLRAFLRGVFLIPLMISGVVSGFMWRMLFDPEYGPMNHLLSLFGISAVRWFTDIFPTRLVVILDDMWLATPFVILVLLAGMQTIPKELYEVGRIDGASEWALFRHITLPFLRYPIMVVVIIRVMDALRAFDMIFMLSRGGPGVSTTTIMLWDYRYAFQFFSMGRATAVSFAFFIIICLITLVSMKVLQRGTD
jgi:multiple sugar transport system permease protein